MIISHSTVHLGFFLKRDWLFLFAQKCEQKFCILSLSIKLVSLAMKKGNSKMRYDTNYINFRLEMVPTESSEPQVCSLANKVDVQVLEKALQNSTLHWDSIFDFTEGFKEKPKKTHISLCKTGLFNTLSAKHRKLSQTYCQFGCMCHILRSSPSK